MHRVPLVALFALFALPACNGEDPAKDGVDPPPVTTDPTTPEPATPPCRPALVPAQETWLEGDTVELSLACTTGVTGPEYVPRLVTAPDGATFDAGAWTLTYATDLADAGPVEVFVTVDVAGGVAESATITVWVNDAGPGVAGNAPPDAASYTEEFGLPVIWCDPAAPVGVAYGPAPCAVAGENVPTARMRIEGPAYPKPSYTIDFGALPVDGAPLDMHDKTTLTLLSNFDDNSHVRQKLAHDLWKDLEDFWEVDRPTPDTTFVVLYLSGAYAGLYTAIDPVDAELMEEQEVVPAGNIHRSVSDDANFALVDALGLPKVDLAAGWTTVDGAGTEDLEALTAWVGASDAETFALSAADWIHVDEFMDWYLLVSYAAAPGAAGNRAYLQVDPVLGGFRYIPGDLAGSFGQGVGTERIPVDRFDEFRVENRIFDHFHTSSVLSFTLWGRYVNAVGVGGPLDTPAIEERLDEYFEDIDAAARRDEAVWGDAYATWPEWAGRPDLTDYEGEKAWLYQWVAGRRAAYDAARP